MRLKRRVAKELYKYPSLLKLSRLGLSRSRRVLHRIKNFSNRNDAELLKPDEIIKVPMTDLLIPDGIQSNGSKVQVRISDLGEIILAEGLSAVKEASETGMDSVEAIVVDRGPKWKKLRLSLATEVQKDGYLYQKIVHPDLDVFPALQNNNDRSRIVQDHLPKDLKTVLDIGSNYGHFSRYLEDQGFDVTAAEDDSVTAHILEMVRDALGYKHKIFIGDVRKYQPSEPVDIIWAFSIFHFFTKTEPDLESLVVMLNRLAPKCIFFQPPRDDEYTDRGWYKIFKPSDFADLVMKSAGLSKVENIGLGQHDRPIYKIT